MPAHLMHACRWRQRRSSAWPLPGIDPGLCVPSVAEVITGEGRPASLAVILISSMISVIRDERFAVLTFDEATRIFWPPTVRSEEHTSELQSLMRISYAVFCLKKKKNIIFDNTTENNTVPQ